MNEPTEIIEPESPYTFQLDIVHRPHGWEARVLLCGGKLRCHHQDRRALVLALNKICIERIMAVVPKNDVEMVLKAYTDYIEGEEAQYYLHSKEAVRIGNNPTLN